MGEDSRLYENCGKTASITSIQIQIDYSQPFEMFYESAKSSYLVFLTASHQG